MELKVIDENRDGQIVQKKSKFIYFAYYIEEKRQAEKLIEDTKKKYYDAKHVVYAYRIFDPKENKIYEKYTEDGEPQGTAGAPILSILQKNNIVNIVIIVVRYFGGTLLGTGGLVSAYSDCAKKSILNNLVNANIYDEILIECGYDNFNDLKHLVDIKSAKLLKILYNSNICCQIATRDSQDFIESIYKNNILVNSYTICGIKLLKQI